MKTFIFTCLIVIISGKLIIYILNKVIGYYTNIYIIDKIENADDTSKYFPYRDNDEEF